MENIRSELETTPSLLNRDKTAPNHSIIYYFVNYSLTHRIAYLLKTAETILDKFIAAGISNGYTHIRPVKINLHDKKNANIKKKHIRKTT